MTKRYIIDIETDSLNPTKIWHIVVLDVETGVVQIARTTSEIRIDPKALYIGHNIIGFDLPALKSLWGITFNPRQIIDTFVCSKLFNYTAKGGHSLEEWGVRLNYPKIEHSEWEALDDPDEEVLRLQRVVERCIGDCHLNRLVFLKLEKAIYSDRWKRSLRIEHETARLCREISDNGFRFDKPRAEDIKRSLSRSIERLALDIEFHFHAKELPWPTKRNPERTRLEPFNPTSPKQVVEILNNEGWQPFEKTEGHKDAEKELSKLQRQPKGERDEARVSFLMERLRHYATYGWKVSEENLETLPETASPGCQLLVKWRMLSKRLQTLDEWLRSYDDKTGRIHGSFNSIGTWTHRKSHSNPNQGNVPSVDSKYHHPELKELARHYGKDMRSLFRVDMGNVLLGVDADGIQLRILAHYMGDQNFIDALVKGSKDNHTDVHSLNSIALGISTKERTRAKTFIYAWLLGAGIGKVAKILGCSFDEAGERVRQFIEYYPGLQRLKTEVIPRDAARGYFNGLDGRIIHCDEYHMLAGYLQSGESIIMKDACTDWHKEFKRERIWYKQVNDVHDEWQTEIRDDPKSREFAASCQVSSIERAGHRMGLLCPLAGTAKFGANWYETH